MKIQNIDAENSNLSNTAVPFYAVGKDKFLYSCTFDENNGFSKWRQGKTPLPAIDIDAKLCVKNGTAFYLNHDQLNVSTDKGDTWTPRALPGKYNCICAMTDQIILVGANIAQGGIAVSVDGGTTWDQPSDTVDKEIHSLAAAAFVEHGSWYAAGTSNGVLLSHDGGKHWQSFLPPDNQNLLDSRIGKILFDNLYIYLIQEAGISRGSLSITGNQIQVDWQPPFTKIPNWYYSVFERDNASGTFFFGNEQLDLGLMVTPSGQFYGYDWDYAGGNISQAAHASNPYAKSSGWRQTVPQLKIPETRSELLAIFFLNPHGVLSVSSDGGGTWQEVNISVA